MNYRRCHTGGLQTLLREGSVHQKFRGVRYLHWAPPNSLLEVCVRVVCNRINMGSKKRKTIPTSNELFPLEFALFALNQITDTATLLFRDTETDLNPLFANSAFYELFGIAPNSNFTLHDIIATVPLRITSF